MPHQTKVIALFAKNHLTICGFAVIPLDATDEGIGWVFGKFKLCLAVMAFHEGLYLIATEVRIVDYLSTGAA